MRVNDEGVPLMTKAYHFAPYDALKYVENFNRGYVMGGNARRGQSHLPQAAVVIARTNARGNVRWSKAFYAETIMELPLQASQLMLRRGEIVFGAVLFKTPHSSYPPRFTETYSVWS